MMTDTLSNPETQPVDLGTTLARWEENPPPSLRAALAEQGVDVEALENYARSGISTEEVEMLRKVLVQAAARNDDDAMLLSRLTPVLDPRERAWDRVLRAKNSGEILSAVVTEAVKGGVVVDLGVRGFVPSSQIGLSVPRNLSQYVGRTLRLRVLEIDRRRHTVILSNRMVQEEERAAKRKQALERLEEGQVRQGTVRRLTDIGAFVDVGGVDGLLHVSEISWKRVERPSDVLKVGQKIQVKVLKVDPAAGRISLSMRRLSIDPWEEIRKKYGIGSTVKVKVSQTVPQGAVVDLEEGADGFIPISELADRRVNSVEEVVQAGQEVEAVVIDLRPRERRVVMSLRKVEQKREREELKAHQRRTQRSDRTTLGDLFGHLFEEYQQDEQPGEEPGAQAAAATEAAPVEAATAEIVTGEAAREDVEEPPAVEAAAEAELSTVEAAPELEELSAVEAAVEAERPAVASAAEAELTVSEAASEEDLPAEEETAPALGAIEAEEPVAAAEDEAGVVDAAVGDDIPSRAGEPLAGVEAPESEPYRDTDAPVGVEEPVEVTARAAEETPAEEDAAADRA
jgi:predicted RNA-binding protein with RPS1 domain